MVLIDTAGLRKRTKVAGDRRLLRPAPLGAGGRARRRRDRGLRRLRGAHLRGPAGRRAGDEDRLRHGVCAQQVGLDIAREFDLDDAKARVTTSVRQRPPVITVSATRRRKTWQAPRYRDRAGRPARGADPHAEAQPVRRLTSSPATRRRPSAASACGSTTRPRSGPRRPGSRSRSTTGANHTRLGLLPREPDARGVRGSRGYR